jgi:lipoyl(octanoyl) transferase
MSHDDFRLLVDEPAPGPWNMGVDEALLEAAVAGSDATLRLYQWNEPTLSLGYFQRYDDREAHAASRDCAIVRRQSGGGAILHDHELTYSLTLPPGHPLGHDATALYHAMHNVFIELLAPQLPSQTPRWQLELNATDSRLPPSAEPFLCFQRRANGDLILQSSEITATNSATSTYKLLGSAQRRHRGAILQHGSLLVSRSSAAPELPGWQDLTGVPLSTADLAAGVVRQFCGKFGVELTPSELSSATRGRTRQIEQEKYSSRSWTARR